MLSLLNFAPILWFGDAAVAYQLGFSESATTTMEGIYLFNLHLLFMLVTLVKVKENKSYFFNLNLLHQIKKGCSLLNNYYLAFYAKALRNLNNFRSIIYIVLIVLCCIVGSPEHTLCMDLDSITSSASSSSGSSNFEYLDFYWRDLSKARSELAIFKLNLASLLQTLNTSNVNWEETRSQLMELSNQIRHVQQEVNDIDAQFYMPLYDLDVNNWLIELIKNDIALHNKLVYENSLLEDSVDVSTNQLKWAVIIVGHLALFLITC